MQEISQVLLALPAPLNEQLADSTSIMDVELVMGERLTHQAKRCLQFSPSAVTRSLAYMMLRELDLKRVFAIIQGRVLKLDEQLIRQAADIKSEVRNV
jgi:V/A-type H+-transporting ATPase subunit C